jgi:FkbM family methyltransferase
MSAYSIIRRITAQIKNKFARHWPNVHLNSTTSKIYFLENGISVFLRPSFSDWVRLREYLSSIYVPDNQLTVAVKNLKPELLVDVGANIGFSSLSLIESFPSVQQVVGIEAEKENFEVLKLNYENWSTNVKFQNTKLTKFFPIYAIASNDSDNNVANVLATRLPGGLSASGTFKFVSGAQSVSQFENSENLQNNVVLEFAHQKISISDVFSTYLSNSSSAIAVVKMDIEGGEEELFLGKSDWLNRTAFLTVEIHDSMGSPCSSRYLLEKLVEHDFAIVPEKDVLHCYNRMMLSL